MQGRAIALRLTDLGFWPRLRALLPAAAPELGLEYIDVMISVIVRRSDDPRIKPFHFVYRNWTRAARTHDLDAVLMAVRQIVANG